MDWHESTLHQASRLSQEKLKVNFDIFGQTVSVLTTFFLLMALYPDVQKAARAEIDGVAGVGGMVALQDRATMPYVNALIKEIMRWGPVAPICMVFHLMFGTLIQVLTEM